MHNSKNTLYYLQILELNLDSCRAPSIDGLTEEYSELESLSLINVGLTTLKGFPSLPKLQKVIYMYEIKEPFFLISKLILKGYVSISTQFISHNDFEKN